MFDIRAEAIVNFRPGEIVDKIEKAEWDAAVKTAVAIENDARDLSPVKTGKNRDSIRVDVGKVGGQVTMEAYTTSGYGGYIERGTFKTRPQPFLEPAVRKNIGKLQDLIREGLR